VAIGKYHDETVDESDSMLLSEGARAVALTSSAGEIEWNHLGNRILEALLNDAVTLAHWTKSLSDSQRALFRGGAAGSIALEMVKHIKAVVGNARQSPEEGQGGDTSGARTNKESGAARAPNEGGKRESLAAQRAEREKAKRRERIASVLDGATKYVSKLANGLKLPKGNNALKMLYDVMPIRTREALFGLRDMAKALPFEVVEYLKCFVSRVEDNGFPDADDPKYFEYSRDMCEKSAPLRQLRDMKRTENALWELAVRRRNETLAYFYYELMPKLA
jgi:hypothetical protein